MYRAVPLGACGLGAASRATPLLDTCSIGTVSFQRRASTSHSVALSLGQRCRLDELVCNGTLVTSVASYAQSLALCVVRRIECEQGAIDLVREHDATDCQVRELRCQGGRVRPDDYFGDKSACEVCVFYVVVVVIIVTNISK